GRARQPRARLHPAEGRWPGGRIVCSDCARLSRNCHETAGQSRACQGYRNQPTLHCLPPLAEGWLSYTLRTTWRVGTSVHILNTNYKVDVHCRPHPVERESSYRAI